MPKQKKPPAKSPDAKSEGGLGGRPTVWISKIVGHDRVDPDQLLANPLNYRRHPQHQRKSLKAAINEVGFIRSVTVNRRTGFIVDGHERVWQAMDIGQPWVDVEYVDLSPEEEAKAIATMDAIGELAMADRQLLDQLLVDVKTEDPSLNTMLDELRAAAITIPDNWDGEHDAAERHDEHVVDEDDIPLPAEGDPITKPGNLWILGDHRLLCGDCRNQAHVDRLFGKASINLVVTSPPYADRREYDTASGFKPIPPDDYVEWFEAVQANVRDRLAHDGSFFLNIKPPAEGLDTDLYVFDLVLAFARRWGWHFSTEFCWERSGVPGRVVRRFKNQFEPVYQFSLGDWKMRPDAVRHESDNVPLPFGPGGGNGGLRGWEKRQGAMGQEVMKRVKGTPAGIVESQGVQDAMAGHEIVEGMAYPGNRLPTFTHTHEALGHAAAFPVGLPAFFIAAYTDKGDTVYEPFCGSGSTLIAAEKLGRVGYGVELSPIYCDTTVARWERLTGRKAVLAK